MRDAGGAWHAGGGAIPLLLLILINAEPTASASDLTISGGGSKARPPDKQKFDAYLAELRKVLGISLPGANISVGMHGATVEQAMGPRSLAMNFPPKYVLTVQKGLGSGVGGYINKQARGLPRTLPRHFILAMWLLYEKHINGKRVRNLWHYWIDTLPPLDNCTWAWDSSELDELEEERVIKRSHSRRELMQKEYDTMVDVLLKEAGLEDDLPNGVTITVDEYAWAVSVVTRYALHLAWDFPIIVPISFRFHPMGAAEVYEWGDEQEPAAVLYVNDEGLRPGMPFTVNTEHFNDGLLLHGGYVWDDIHATRPRLLLSEGKRDMTNPLEVRRRELRDASNWTSPMDFDQTAEGLNVQMLAWLRLSFANAEELDAISSPHEDCERPLSPPSSKSTTERQVVHALLATLEQVLGRYDYSVEEDEQILLAGRRQQSLPPRTELAVTYRKLCKQVLLRTRDFVSEHWKNFQRSRGQKSLGQPTADDAAAGTAPKRKRRKTKRKK